MRCLMSNSQMPLHGGWTCGAKLSFSTRMLFTGAVPRPAVHRTVVTDTLMSQTNKRILDRWGCGGCESVKLMSVPWRFDGTMKLPWLRQRHCVHHILQKEKCPYRVYVHAMNVSTYMFLSNVWGFFAGQNKVVLVFWVLLCWTRDECLVDAPLWWSSLACPCKGGPSSKTLTSVERLDWPSGLGAFQQTK